MLIFAAIVAIFVYGMISAMLGTILPDLSDRFHLSPRQNGSIAFAQALGLIIASLGVGPLLDNEGKKLGLIIGLALIATTLFALPRSSGFRSILFLLFLLGVGGGIVVTGANALVSDVGEAHRATALNMVNLFFGLGGLATPFIAANLFGRNWVRLCYTIAALTIVSLAIEASTKMPEPTRAGGFVLADAAPVLGRPLLFLLGLFLFLYVSCEVGIWNWLPRHLIAQGIARAQHSFPGIRARPADWPCGCLPHPHSRSRDHRLTLRIGRDGYFDFSDAAAERSFRRCHSGLPRRAFHGASFPHHARHRW
jgi:fucose permease